MERTQLDIHPPLLTYRRPVEFFVYRKFPLITMSDSVRNSIQFYLVTIALDLNLF